MAELLTIPQAFLLLHTDDDGRRRTTAKRLDLGLAGGVLADLALRGAIDLDRNRVLAGPLVGSGDPVLDTTHARIAGSPVRSASWWIRQVGRPELRAGVTAGLVARGTLASEQRPALALTLALALAPATRHPVRDRRPLDEVQAAIADSLAGRAPASPFVATMIGLLDAVGTVRSRFGPVDQRHVRDLVAGDQVSPAVRRVLSHVRTASTTAVLDAATAVLPWAVN
ncbi:GOLPH3/VPS74 family protein [Curtobacterium citreum]|uniref:GOLPH3/VPS74 family protein n=1 Tax=Curtobacterium citreum TaxID=2036 RepID=UPI00073605FE|nr:GPP34 family phosphoprotein [Curtobacterium citreum]